MTFIVENAQVMGNNQSRESVDWDALNASVIEQAGLQERETLTGIISLVIDLGTQEQPDAEFESNIPLEEEAEIEEKFKGTYFKDGINGKRMRCWEQDPIQCITLAVDFPDIMVDRSEFFEDSEPKPLRLYLGGQFYNREHGMVVSNMIPLRLSKTGGFNEKSSLAKMALASKIIKSGEEFKASSLGELVGKSLQFEAQVFMKKAKNGKEYYTEYIRYVGGLPRGMEGLKLPYEPQVVTFNGDNDETSVLELRNHVKNTIRMAENYSGSKIEVILDGSQQQNVSEKKEVSATAAAENKKATAPTTPVAETVEEGDFDFDDIPF